MGHLLGVAAIVIQHGGGEDEAIAALLHDAVEDQGGLPRLDEIREKFGDRVARIVDGCTDSSKSPAKNGIGARGSALTLKKSRTSPKTSGSFPLRTNWPMPAKFFLTIAWKATPFSTASAAARTAPCGITALWLMFFAERDRVRSLTNSTAS